MSTHVARIAKVDSIAPIQGADRIQIAYVLGNQVIVSKDTKVGDIGVFFDCELQLDEKYCAENNLFRKKELNKDKDKAGYIGDNRRLKVEKFMKIAKSEGLFMPLSSLEYTGHDISKLKAGDTFDELNGVKICQKYINEKTRRFMESNRVKKPKAIQAPTFIPHVDSENIKYYWDAIPKGALITLSSKSHGCVDKNTLIQTEEYGSLRIQEIVEKKIKCKIKAFDTKLRKEVFVPIDDYYFFPNSDDWYEIELEDGSKIEITGNNPVWLPDYHCYRRVDKLRVGDNLFTTK